ncbi:MAG: phospho-N-acetylmuramoyl-pentapeptide-transferase [Pirellulales bacterium]
MLLWFIDRLLARWPNACDPDALAKITSRAGLAALASFVLAMLCGPRWIAWLQARYREPIKSASPDVARLHQQKNATPTMGGLFIVAGITLAAVVFADWSNCYVPVVVAAVLALAALGAVDDLVKLRTSARGITARVKFAAQVVIACIAATLIHRLHADVGGGLDFRVPWTIHSVSLGAWFIPLATLIIVGSSNAVNLTDGLDGLAGGCLVCATGALGIVTYASGHVGWAHYLNIPYIPEAGEATVLAAATLGGLLAFLWFNCHPASVFMGDTGSLPLGGLLGLLAVIARLELLLVAIGGVFVAEAASVIVQVAWFRCTGRRVFRCAPVHHHFQLQGWPEDKIVVRFWIAGALCAVVGLIGLKLAAGDPPSAPQLTNVQRLTR